MNRVYLIGNLTRDPEVRTTEKGETVCNFGIAVNRNRANASGERKTDFFDVAAWRGLGETVAKYMKKGSKIAVNGTLQTRDYTDEEGKRHTRVTVVASDVEFLTPKKQEISAHDDSAEDQEIPF